MILAQFFGLIISAPCLPCRNKQQLLSAGVIPLMEQMIQKPETCEAAVAMYLNLSCLEEAQAIIGSSEVIHVLIRCVQEEGYRSGTCRLDALLTLYNLSLHAPNIPPLLSSGIVQSIHAVLAPSSSSSSSWTPCVQSASPRASRRRRPPWGSCGRS